MYVLLIFWLGGKNWCWKVMVDDIKLMNGFKGKLIKKNYVGKREDEVVYRWNYFSRGVLIKLFFRSVFIALKERKRVYKGS